MMPLLEDWIAELFAQPDLLLMGHGQRAADNNLGLGWLYYALVRIVRPTTAVAIGSYRGFAPMVLARALGDNRQPDNSESATLHFIDPSLVDGFWKDPAAVRDYFASFGLTNITHHAHTTQNFINTPAYKNLESAGLILIDGFHTADQARIDFRAFAPKLAPQGVILLHDSIWRLRSPMYGPGREYERNVVDFVAELKTDASWQVFDVPFGEGVTLVRRNINPPECLDPSPPRAPRTEAPR